MSETKTKNLCTVPAADLTDSQYFIAEDGGELKRIPKAQVVLKKLENMLATDTENLAGGGEVTAQELLDALAEQVANKLLAKSQVVNNLLATVEGNPLDATQGKALKELIDTTNNNLSNANSKITRLYSDMSNLNKKTFSTYMSGDKDTDSVIASKQSGPYWTLTFGSNDSIGTIPTLTNVHLFTVIHWYLNDSAAMEHAYDTTGKLIAYRYKQWWIGAWSEWAKA